MPLPWFKRQGEELPPELQNMEAKDLLDAVAKSKELDTVKADLEATKGKLSEFDTIKSKLAALEANSAPPPPPERKGPTSVLEDEDAAFNERMAPLATTMLTNQAQNAKFIAYSQLSPLDKKIWDKYTDEVETVMKTVGLQYQAQAATWVNALTTIKGRHFDDLRKMENDKSEFFSETGGSNGQGGSNEPTLDKLSDEDKRLAKRLGVTEEAYLASKKEMVIRG